MEKPTAYEYEAAIVELTYRYNMVEECTDCGYPKLRAFPCGRCERLKQGGKDGIYKDRKQKRS